MALSLYGLISESERAFIIGGVNEDMRSDGRSCSDFRSIEMETDSIATTNGSARIRIGSTELLVGIKAELEKPTISDPDKGRGQAFNIFIYYLSFENQHGFSFLIKFLIMLF